MKRVCCGVRHLRHPARPSLQLCRWVSAAAPATPAPAPSLPPGVVTTTIARELPLSYGNKLPSVTIAWKQWGDANDGKPVVYIMPSMSHSAYVTSAPTERSTSDTPSTSTAPRGWWEQVVGYGSQFGIDLNHYRVVCASPLGAPYGTSSPLTINPLTNKPYGAHFPQITPADQARAHSYLMDHLGLQKVFAVVGASMGGMQVLQYACMYPDRWQRAVAIAATGRTSPSTVALRSVQRSAVMADPKYHGGHYRIGDGPTVGLGIARRIGTIAYRSRQEFDHRFNWTPDAHHRFEVEQYLDHAAQSFQTRYDANCYLLLSRCMDLMNLGDGQPSFEHGVRRIPAGKEVMLLPYIQDALIPAKEMEKLAVLLGSNGVRVHHEPMSSKYGHDAFLKEFDHINPRLHAFLSEPKKNGVENVRQYVASLS